MLGNLPQNATVHVQNENELAAVGATDNLRGLAANVKFISGGSGTNQSAEVNQKHSRELTKDGRVVAVVDEDILSNLNLSNWNQETKETAQAVLAVDEIEDLSGSVHSMADKAVEKKYPGKSSSIKVAELLELVNGDAEKYIPKQEIVRESSDKNNPDIRYSRELTTDGRVVAVVGEDESSPTVTTNKSPDGIFEDSPKDNVAQQE